MACLTYRCHQSSLPHSILTPLVHLPFYQAFWPSLQVLAGELQAAKVSHRAFYSLWREFDALPDIFDARGRQLITYARDSPLRPELVESTYHLYMATKDPHYLNVGKELLFALQVRGGEKREMGCSDAVWICVCVWMSLFGWCLTPPLLLPLVVNRTAPEWSAASPRSPT